MNAVEAKQELPNVLIRWHGKLWTGRVTGRLNRFATVSPWVEQSGRRPRTIIGPCFEFSWDAVARAASLNSPKHALRAD